MNLALIETAQKFLFADEREMQEAGLSQTTRGRMIRLRDIYNHWLIQDYWTRISSQRSSEGIASESPWHTKTSKSSSSVWAR